MNKVFNTEPLKKGHIVINEVQLEEVLEKRLNQGILLQDLFLVAVGGHEFFDFKMETKFGKLLTFSVPWAPRNLLLSHKKFPYPKADSAPKKERLVKLASEFIN